MFFALLRKRPIDWTYGMSPSTPSATMAAGVAATGKSFAVALFTPLSVACADSTTATSSSNGVRCESSDAGFGLAARRRSKIARRFCGFTASPVRRFAVGDRGEAGEARRFVRGEPGVVLERRVRLRGPGSRGLRVAARERDFGELLVDVAVGLADPLEFRGEALLRRLGVVEAADAAVAARDRPFRHARRRGVAHRLARGERLLPVVERRLRVAGVEIGPADVVVQRRAPAARARIGRRLGERERLQVPAEALRGRRRDAEHVRGVDRVELVLVALGERQRLGEQRHRPLRRAGRVERAAPLQQIADAHVRRKARELRLDAVEQRVRVGELALQAERARDLRAHLLRFRRCPAATSRARRESALRTAAGLSKSQSASSVDANAGVDGAAAEVVMARKPGRRRRRATAIIFGRDRRPRGARERGRAPPRSRPCASRRASSDSARGDARGGPSSRRWISATCRSRAARASSRLHARPAGTIAMQSTGQGGMHSAHPVHNAGSTVCMRFAAPTIASTGQASMHSVQPMHADFVDARERERLASRRSFGRAERRGGR